MLLNLYTKQYLFMVYWNDGLEQNTIKKIKKWSFVMLTYNFNHWEVEGRKFL